MTPQLVYAQGDITDLSKRIFTNITGFQYAVWALDGSMWEVILQYLPHVDAAAQITAYAARIDLIQQHGQHYSFDEVVSKYNHYIQHYGKWTEEQYHHHWQKGVGTAQATMPSWIVYAFTEPGTQVAWVQFDATIAYKRVQSNEFKNFQRVIESGNGFLRWHDERAMPRFMVAGVRCLLHDRNMILRFKVKSHGQRQMLDKTLIDSSLHDAYCRTSGFTH